MGKFSSAQKPKVFRYGESPTGPAKPGKETLEGLKMPGRDTVRKAKQFPRGKYVNHVVDLVTDIYICHCSRS